MDERQNLDIMKSAYEKNGQNINPILKEAIEKEIRVKEYAIDPDEYERNIRNEAAKKATMRERNKGNRRLKVFKTRVAIAAVACLVLASPVIVKETKVAMNKIIEIDNENFEKDIEQQKLQVEELTGHTMEEILGRGNSR